MRKLVLALAPALVGVFLAGAAQAQQHPWVPSNFSGLTGSRPNGAPAAISEQHPWVPSDVYAGNQRNSAPAWASSRAAVPAAGTAHASKRHTTEAK